jgi:RNA exonuclease 1
MRNLASLPAQVLAGVLENASKYDFTFARFLDLSHALGWSQPSTAINKIPFRNDVIAGNDLEDVDAPPSDAQVLEEAYTKLNDQLAQLHASLPPRSALIVFTGHDDPRAMSQLMAKKTKFEQLWKNRAPSEIAAEDRWLEEEDRQLQALVEQTRVGMSFYCVT